MFEVNQGGANPRKIRGNVSAKQWSNRRMLRVAIDMRVYLCAGADEAIR